MSVSIWKSVKDQSRHLVQSVEERMEAFRAQFLTQAKDSLLKLAESLMEQEAVEKAGPRYQRAGVTGHGRVTRAGSDRGSIRIGHQRVLVRKQRLKQGKQEVPLESYKGLRQSDLLTARVLDCMVRGLSTRDYDELLDEISGGLGLSKSSVSRAFVDGSRDALEQLQCRDLSRERWSAIQVDAIYFGRRSLIVALGVNSAGRKIVLGLHEGNTESSQVCIDLFQSLVDRGLRTDHPVLFVLDGGKGLRKAVREVFGENAPVQRCLVHKARNLEEYIPQRLHPELRRRWARLRRCERYSDAKVELQQLRQWLGLHAQEAVSSLDEAGEELLTCFRYGANRVLRRSLMTTNIIESMFARVRHITARVKNWKHPKTPSRDQIKRWLAVALLSAERTAPYIKGYGDLGPFMLALEEKSLQAQAVLA
jgi:putative transposase